MLLQIIQKYYTIVLYVVANNTELLVYYTMVLHVVANNTDKSLMIPLSLGNYILV